jgi:ABC-type Fe3+ transport system permease subunit
LLPLEKKVETALFSSRCSTRALSQTLLLAVAFVVVVVVVVVVLVLVARRSPNREDEQKRKRPQIPKEEKMRM